MRYRRGARRRPALIICAIALLGTLLSAPVTIAEQADRIVAVGDIHGADTQLRALLQILGLTDASHQWIGGSATLVQTGDYTDRGVGVRRVLDLLMRLEREADEAGGQVMVLLGNHEAMNLMHHVRDTTPALLAHFADAKSEGRQQDAYEEDMRFRQQRAEELGPLALPDPTREEWMTTHPPGLIEYLDALGPDGHYGRWLRKRPVVVRVGDSILLHGGLHPDAPNDLDDINDQAHREIETYDRYRKQLWERDIILPFYSYQETLDAVRTELQAWAIRLAPTGPPAPDAATLNRRERRYLEMLIEFQRELPTWSLIHEDSPLWFRGFARWDEDTGPGLVDTLTERYDAARIVVGHSIPPSRLITTRFDNRIFLIDTGMLTAFYTGRASALEIRGDAVTAVYLDRQVSLVSQTEP